MISKGLGSADASTVASWSAFVLLALWPIFLLVPYLSLHVGALVALVAVFLAARREGRPLRSVLGAATPGVPVYLFFGLAFLSALWAEVPQNALSWAIKDSYYPVFLALCLTGLSNGKRWFLRATLVFPVVCLLAFFYLLARFGSIRPSSARMIAEVGSVSDTFATASILCLPFLVYLFLQSRGTAKLLASVSLLSAAAVLALSGGRAVFLLLFPVVLLSGLFLGRGFRGKAILIAKVGMATGAVFVVAVLVAPSLTVAGRTESLFGFDLFSRQATQAAENAPTVLPEQSAAVPDIERSVMYRESIKMVRENPIMGAGYMGLMPRMKEVFGHDTGSHNVVVSAWGELGLAGLSLALWIFGRAALNAWKRRNDAFYAAAGVSLLVAAAHAQITSQQNNAVFYALLSVLLASSVRTERTIR